MCLAIASSDSERSKSIQCARSSGNSLTTDFTRPAKPPPRRKLLAAPAAPKSPPSALATSRCRARLCSEARTTAKKRLTSRRRLDGFRLQRWIRPSIWSSSAGIAVALGKSTISAIAPRACSRLATRSARPRRSSLIRNFLPLKLKLAGTAGGASWRRST